MSTSNLYFPKISNSYSQRHYYWQLVAIALVLISCLLPLSALAQEQQPADDFISPPASPSRSAPSFAGGSAGECPSCRQRKENLCAKECAAVAYEMQRHCRISCINEYCAHRCKSTINPDQKIPCNECFQEEFISCGATCTKGTEFQINQCKEACAKGRCKGFCANN